METLEPHYSVKQLAEAWGFSEDVIRHIFRNEPGVLKLARPATRSKRGYVSLTIPASVAEAVHRRMSR
jgi:hypothetical protein